MCAREKAVEDGERQYSHHKKENASQYWGKMHFMLNIMLRKFSSKAANMEIIISITAWPEFWDESEYVYAI